MFNLCVTLIYSLCYYVLFHPALFYFLFMISFSSFVSFHFPTSYLCSSWIELCQKIKKEKIHIRKKKLWIRKNLWRLKSASTTYNTIQFLNNKINILFYWVGMALCFLVKFDLVVSLSLLCLSLLLLSYFLFSFSLNFKSLDCSFVVLKRIMDKILLKTYKRELSGEKNIEKEDKLSNKHKCDERSSVNNKGLTILC